MNEAELGQRVYELISSHLEQVGKQVKEAAYKVHNLESLAATESMKPLIIKAAEAVADPYATRAIIAFKGVQLLGVDPETFSDPNLLGSLSDGVKRWITMKADDLMLQRTEKGVSYEPLDKDLEVIMRSAELELEE